MGFIVISGSIMVKTNDEAFTMTEPPGPALLIWNSQKGIQRAQRLPKLPEWISPSPPLPPGLEARRRSAMLSACDELNGNLSTKDVAVGLSEALSAQDESLKVLSVRCRGALDDYPELVDLLTHKNQQVRISAMDTLERWIVLGRNNDYLLWPELKSKFPREAEKIMELLHGFADREVLMDYLQNPSPVIREMAGLRLARMDALKKAAGGK
jgi:hypothetical protein